MDRASSKKSAVGKKSSTKSSKSTKSAAAKSAVAKSGTKSAAKSTENPTLKGWAFELEQIQVIKGVLQSPMDNALVHIEGSNGLKFRPTKALEYDGTTLNGDFDDPGDDDDVVGWCLCGSSQAPNIASVLPDPRAPYPIMHALNPSMHQSATSPMTGRWVVGLCSSPASVVAELTG